MTQDTIIRSLAELLGPEIDRQKATRYGLNAVSAYSQKHTLAGDPITTGYSHGPGGLLTFPGVDPVMFNAAMGPQSILSRIPTMPSLYTDPTYFTITGVTDESGDEPSDVCDDAPVAGLMKGCLTHSVFGRYERATNILEINRLGQRIDRSDPLDLQLVGSPLAPGGIFSGPGGSQAAPADVLTNEVSRKFWELNVAFYRLLSRQVWSGSPANNTGARKEMTGIELLVNTGYVDAETGNACPAMDSYVVDANYTRFDLGGQDIVHRMTSTYYELKSRAFRSGVAPVRWEIAMRSQMFYELTAAWPCSYLSYRCDTALTGTSNTVNNIDAQDAIRIRDEMRAGRYLLIDGDRVDVIVDDGIPEDTNTTNGSVPSGCFASDIYFLPMSVAGGRSVLYMEYFQFTNPSITEAMGNMVLGRIEGAWITWPKQRNLCVQWQSKIEPRMVLRTPWLAARIQNVSYCPVQHERSPFPDEPYFVNGGKTDRAGYGPSYVDLWDA